MSSKRKGSIITDATPASGPLTTKMSMPFQKVLKQKMVTPDHRNRSNHNKPTGTAASPKSVLKTDVSDEKTVSSAAAAASSEVTSPPSLEDVQAEIYVEDFIGTDDLADDVARKTSRLLELHCKQQNLLELLEVSMEEFLTTDRADSNSVDGLQRLLVLASEMGDDGVEISQEIEDMVGDKLHDLDTDMRKLMLTNPSKENLSSSANPGTGQAEIPPRSPNNNSSIVVSSSTGAETEPGPSSKNSCRSFKKQKTLLSFDGLALRRGKGHQRTCKSRNPPNYTGIRVTATATVGHRKYHRTSVKKNKVKKAPSKVHVKKSGSKETASPIASTRMPTPPPPIASSAAEVKIGNTPSEEKDEDDTVGNRNGNKTPEPLYCVCEGVSFGKMVQCDNHLCPLEWFHFKCVGLKTKPAAEEIWYCPNCRGEHSAVKKPQSMLIKGLQQYYKDKDKDENQ